MILKKPITVIQLDLDTNRVLDDEPFTLFPGAQISNIRELNTSFGTIYTFNAIPKGRPLRNGRLVLVGQACSPLSPKIS